MENNNNEGKKKRDTVLRVAVVLMIVAVVAGIWFFKNRTDGDAPAATIADFDHTFRFDLEEILSQGKPVIIQFGGEGCPPCIQMQPDLIAAYVEMKVEAVFVYVDVWKDPSAGDGFPLRVVPTQFFFDREGNATIYNEGTLTKQEIISILKGMDIND
ncbi:MAG: thioredoxin family protein [Clostridia bacterium]